MVFSLLLLSLFQCGKDDVTCADSPCGTDATVVDLTGLDGCGLVFELADGTRLEPEMRTYVQAPTIEEDPLYHFEMKAGQKVKISWQESLAMTVCMNGKIVFITCISECKNPAD